MVSPAGPALETQEEVPLGTWKDPHAVSWHYLVCYRCGRLIDRVKIAGLVRRTAYRLCDVCAGTGQQRQAERRRGEQA